MSRYAGNPEREPTILSEAPVGRLFSDAGTVSIPMLDDDLQPVLGASGKPLHITTPSAVAFTWAYVVVNPDGTEHHRGSGYVLAPLVVSDKPYPAQAELAEFFALSKGFHWLAKNRPGWCGEVCCDNHLALARVFRGAATRSLPPEWVELAAKYRRRLGTLVEVPINGHPTKEHLRRGYGHSNRPVSSWNVLTDDLCEQQRLPALEDWHVSRRNLAPPPIQEAADRALQRHRDLAKGFKVPAHGEEDLPLRAEAEDAAPEGADTAGA